MKIQDIQAHHWLGIPAQAEESFALQAGDLTLEFRSGRLLHISCLGHILISEIYFALRDPQWNTIPYTLHNFRLSRRARSFRIGFTARHAQAPFLYEWEGLVTGTEDSKITVSFEGKSLAPFMRNRIGFCLLHPLACSGQPIRVIHSGGAEETGFFPRAIAPHQPFVDIRGIESDTPDGARIRADFEGDVFEMEDQRNWTDASFKTYCTPLGLPFPVRVGLQERTVQMITLSLLARGRLTPENEPARTIDYDMLCKSSAPGFRLGSLITRPLTERELARTRKLGLSHLRYDLHFPLAQSQTDAVFRQAGQLGLPVKLAVFFTEDWQTELELLKRLAGLYARQLSVVLVFRQGKPVIAADVLAAVRHALADYSVAVGSGTDAFFAQVNRAPLPATDMDMVSYSNNPQVHAFDNDSIMATVEGQAANLFTCRALYPGLPLSVSPVSLKMRWNPDSAGSAAARPPADVDERQMSLFAAAWFLRSVTACQPQAAEADYFELTGPCGLMADEGALPCAFPAEPGMVYPLYIAFWALERYSDAQVSSLRHQDVTVLRLERNHQIRVIISNPLGRPVELCLSGFPETGRSLLMEEKSVSSLVKGLEGADAQVVWQTCVPGRTLVLAPYATMILDYDKRG